MEEALQQAVESKASPLEVLPSAAGGRQGRGAGRGDERGPSLLRQEVDGSEHRASCSGPPDQCNLMAPSPLPRAGPYSSPFTVYPGAALQPGGGSSLQQVSRIRGSGTGDRKAASAGESAQLYTPTLPCPHSYQGRGRRRRPQARLSSPDVFVCRGLGAVGGGDAR